MNVEVAFLLGFCNSFFLRFGEGIRFELVLVFLDLGEDAFRDKKETKKNMIIYKLLYT